MVKFCSSMSGSDDSVLTIYDNTDIYDILIRNFDVEITTMTTEILFFLVLAHD